MWTAATGWLSARWTSIHTTASSGWGRIKSAMTGPLSAAWRTITTTVGHIKSTISTGLNHAYDAVANIGDKFESIGKDIVKGIARGVTSLGGYLTDKLKGVANGALNGAKSFLGIGSPSRVFADQVGRWIPAGIAAGVTAHASVAHRAVGSLAASLPTAAGAIGGSYALGLGAGGGATVIHQSVHLTVQGHVMTDKQLTAVVQEGFLTLGQQNPGTFQPYQR